MLITEERHELELFGTRVRLLIGRGARPSFRPIGARDVEDRLTALHRRLTRFDPDSELSHLNDNAGHAVRVSAMLLRAMREAVRGAELSDGLVDPTILPALEKARAASSRVGCAPASLTEALAVPPPRRPAAATRAAAWRSIDVDPVRSLVRLTSGTRTDLGGAAKRLAVDLAAEMLSLAPAFALDAGGDTRTGGTAALPREVEIEHPLTGLPAHRVKLISGAVATSGPRIRIWRTGCGYAQHLIDPARGVPAWTGVIQATTFVPTRPEAQTRAKAARLKGPLRRRSTLEHYGGLLILDSGEVIALGKPSQFLAQTPNHAFSA